MQVFQPTKNRTTQETLIKCFIG